MDHYYAVIMAGGGGTRLWPLSRRARPKQMLRLFAEKTLFQIAVERLNGLFPPERILVVTVTDQASELRAQCPDIPVENFLLEPMPRGTASVVGLAAINLTHRDPEAIMAILTADHYIRDVVRFQQILVDAREVAEEGYLVTLGIDPDFPATGFGYIQLGAPLGIFKEIPVYRVKRFIEKPDQRRAEAMLAEGKHAWNSGMFIWRADRILAEIDRQMPDLAQGLQEINRSLGTDNVEDTLLAIWPELRKETIDYGVMEGAGKVAVLPITGLGWSDVGSWDSLFGLLPGDEYGNLILRGEHIQLDTRDTLLYNEPGQRLVVTIGVEDLVVIDTDDVLLICRKKQAQKVRTIVQQLEKLQRVDLL